ncbi:MAG: PTS fructose transporter subunit IIA [Legionellales bacterium]|nr:PTS fructose transporter subunit IIA [Legionellales bacterium]|tara:strand:+ start:181 stop:627 length:447 start_codon:yes stop_codon:yes gene_type:complete
MTTRTGILLITHYGIGDALIEVAKSTFGEELPLQTSVLSVGHKPRISDLVDEAQRDIRQLDFGRGVLILTDMFGSTPSNISKGLVNSGHQVAVVAGLNLPMLIRLMNYPDLPLNQMAEKALSGGKDGVFYPYAPAITSRLSEEAVVVG